MKVTFSQPAVAERSMYFGMDPFWKAGHESAGVPAPAAAWFLAEGATGAFFETFVLIANPQDTDAEVTLRFLPEGGASITKNKTIPVHSRMTVNIESEDPALANAAVATGVVSTVPTVVERAQYWPDPAPQWYEAHNLPGGHEPGGRLRRQADRGRTDRRRTGDVCECRRPAMGGRHERDRHASAVDRELTRAAAAARPARRRLSTRRRRAGGAALHAPGW